MMLQILRFSGGNILNSLTYFRCQATEIIKHDYLLSKTFSHVPVMAQEIVQVLKPEDGKVFIDMTFGAGGHSRKLLDSNKSIKIIAVDRDPVAFRKAQELAQEVAKKSDQLNINQSVIPIHGKFSAVMDQIHLSGVPYDSVHGVLFDLGASSMQFDDPKRGFALSMEGRLDMRMDTTNESDLTAEDVVNNLTVEELGYIFRQLGGEKRSRKISNAIGDARALLGRIKTTRELARIIASNAPANIDAIGRLSHPGTKVFQALRIFVNNELNELNYAMEKIRKFLIPIGDCERLDKNYDDMNHSVGVAAVLTFHSLEDKIVKRHFTGQDPNEPELKSLTQHARIRTSMYESLEDIDDLAASKFWKPIWSHVKKPSKEEIEANPRSRSAKLRAAIRIS